MFNYDIRWYSDGHCVCHDKIMADGFMDALKECFNLYDENEDDTLMFKVSDSVVIRRIDPEVRSWTVIMHGKPDE